MAGIYDVEPSNNHYFNGGMIEKISQERPDNQVTILKDTAPLYSFALTTIILRGFFLPVTSLRNKIIIIIIIIVIISCSSDPFVLEVTL